jgi:hypothetical protein
VEQLDFIGMDDRLAARRRLLDESVRRLGLNEVAHQLREDPSTIDNQLARRGPKRPSADLADICDDLDPVYRAAKAALMGELLVRPPDMTPEETVRALLVEAQSQGFVAKARVAEMVSRMRVEPKTQPEPHTPLRAVGR